MRTSARREPNNNAGQGGAIALAPLHVAHNDTITAPADGVCTAAHAFDAHDVLRVVPH